MQKICAFCSSCFNPDNGKNRNRENIFLKAFGTTTDEFRELLLMPEFMIRNRWNCELSGKVDSWREALFRLNEDEQLRVAEYIKTDEYDNPAIFQHDSPRVQTFLHFYSLKETDIPIVFESIRSKAVEEFEAKWHNVNVRIFEVELKQEEKKLKSWPFRIDHTDKK